MNFEAEITKSAAICYPKISRTGLPEVRGRETPELSAAKFKGMPIACRTVAWMS